VDGWSANRKFDESSLVSSFETFKVG
jgi:hypothetical protein